MKSHKTSSSTCFLPVLSPLPLPQHLDVQPPTYHKIPPVFQLPGAGRRWVCIRNEVWRFVVNSAQKHLLVFISKKFVYQAEICRSTFSDFSRICLSTNSVHHLTFYRLIKSSKTNVDELTLKCKRYYIMEIWNCIYETNISSIKFFYIYHRIL